MAGIKLFVDDLRDAPDDTWMVVRDIEDAKQVLLKGHVTDLSLDHDMGRGYDGDGSKLVTWMAENGWWPEKRPVIHSANPVGREYMAGVIERYGPYSRD